MKIEPEEVPTCVFQTEQKNRGPLWQLQSNLFLPCILNGYYELQSCEPLAMLMKVPAIRRARGPHGATQLHQPWGEG